jgi:hypothetical protein
LTYQSAQQHDRRTDFLNKNPSMLQFALNSPDLRLALLAVKAHARMMRRLNRSGRSASTTVRIPGG